VFEAAMVIDPDIENLTGDAVFEVDGQKAAAAMFAKVVWRGLETRQQFN
jgi:hypothetical protein